MPSASGTTPYAQPPAQAAQPMPSTRPAQPYAQQGAASPGQPAVPMAQQPMQPTASTMGQQPMQPTASAMGQHPDQASEGATQPRPRHHATRTRHKRHQAGHVAHNARRGGQPNDHVADQLNREEAYRLASGSSMPPGGSGQMPMQGQAMPMQQGGPGAGQPMSGQPAGQMR